MRSFIFSTSLVCFAIIAMSLSLILNIVNFVVLRSENYSPTNHRSSLPIKLRDVALSITNDPEGRYGLNNAKDWRSLVPHHGFVRLSDESDNIYELSMYHQIHCLMGYRQYFNWMLEGVEITAHAVEHVDHCSSYLTQLMMCAADTTLEPTITAINNRTGRRVHSVKSVGVLHKCKDWTQVRDWVEKNYYRWQAEEKHYSGEDIN